MQITSYQNNMAVSSEQAVSKENGDPGTESRKLPGKRYEVGKGTVLELEQFPSIINGG